MQFYALSLLSLFLFLTVHPLVADQSNHTINIDITAQPTMGYPKAKVQVVALLEPKCPDSKKYNDQIYPKLEQEFIHTHKVRYTVIPVSFLPNSMPAAIALLCVYNQDSQHPNKDFFFSYLNYLYKHQPPEKENWATIETMQKFAAATNSAIDVSRLKDCIAKENYRVQVEKNTTYGKQLMQGHLSTPTIFVDGVQLKNTHDTIDWENLKSTIEAALQKKE